MATSKKGAASAAQSSIGSVFGATPTGEAIYVPSKPYQLRLNCKSGSINKTETKRLCDELDVSIIKIGHFFGSLGRTVNEEWFQLFMIPMPGQKVPANTVCVTYIKKESLTLFGDRITEIQISGSNPAAGIFHIGFEPRTGAKGQYFVVDFNWRDRETEAEHEQLTQILDFMQGPMINHVVDMNGTRDMVNLEGMDAGDRNILLTAAARGLSPRNAYRVVLGESFEAVLAEQIRLNRDDEVSGGLARR